MISADSFLTPINPIVNVALMSLWDLRSFVIWPNIHRCSNKCISDTSMASMYLLLDRKYKITQYSASQQLWHWHKKMQFSCPQKKPQTNHIWWLKFLPPSLASEITQEGTLQLKQLKFGKLISKWKLECYSRNYWATS